MFSWLTEFVIKRPRLVIVLTLLSVAIFGYGIRFLGTDTDVTRDLPQNIPAKALYDRIDQLFPSKEMVIVGIESDKLFTVDSIQRLDSLTSRIEEIDGVQSAMSMTNAPVIAANEMGMEVKPAADPLPQTPQQVQSYRAKMFDQPLYIGSIINKTGNATIIMVFVKAGFREADVAEKLIDFSKDAKLSEGFELAVTGRPAATYWAKIIMGRDMGMLSSAALLVVILMLVITFRSARGVLLPVGVVATAVIWTLGLMGYAGIPITHATEVMPILLVAIGVADGIHIVKGYYQRARDSSSPAEVVRETMRDLNRPVFLTSITTMAGFIALGTSGIGSIVSLGLLTAFGVFAAMIFSLTFIPAILTITALPGAKSSAEKRQKAQRFVAAEKLAQGYAQFLVDKRAMVAAAIVMVIAAAIVGATQVPSEFSNLSNFRPDHPFIKATLTVNKNFASTTNLLVVVEGGKEDAIKDPRILAKMDALEKWLVQQPHVGSVQSVVGRIKQMHKVMHGDKPEQYRVPNVEEQEVGTEFVEVDGEEVEQEVTFKVPGRELVAQYLTLYEMSGKPEDFANLVTYDFSTARMTVFIDSDRATVLTQVHNNIRGYLDKNFGDTPAQLTGMAELIRAVNELVVTGQAWSILTSLLLVLVLTGLMFRSFLVGIFATTPLFFSLFLNFGIMGLLGIPLNIMTMATSSIAVGVGIDYAIHFVHRYQHDRLEGFGYGESVIKTMKSSGVAIFLNAITVALGFLALFFSEFRGVAHMGLLIALTMFTSAFAALTILPILFVFIRPKVFNSLNAAAAMAAAAPAPAPNENSFAPDLDANKQDQDSLNGRP